MARLSLQNEVFDRTLTLRQSFELLLEFVQQYHARGESSTLNLLVDAGICSDGTTCDPAQIYDYLRVAGRVLDDDRLEEAANQA